MEEQCPVCWRAFSAQLVPYTLICGHSLCADCSDNLKKCPLCRKRLSVGHQRITNYSLLSLVGRLEQGDKKETKDQEIQTDSQIAVRRRLREEEGQTNRPAKQKPLVIKLGQLGHGQFKHIELKFK